MQCINTFQAAVMTEDRDNHAKAKDNHAKQFPLRLARSLREAANLIARREGISLNHFISLAVAEKVSRIGQVSASPPDEKRA
jgi:predicted HicB family RNase H-like nuclease